MLHSICQQIWKTQQWPQDWKSSVFIPIPKTGNAKECSNYRTIALISHSSRVMLKILQARLQQYMNCDFPDVQAGFKKAKEPEIKLSTSLRRRQRMFGMVASRPIISGWFLWPRKGLSGSGQPSVTPAAFKGLQPVQWLKYCYGNHSLWVGLNH